MLTKPFLYTPKLHDLFRQRKSAASHCKNCRNVIPPPYLQSSQVIFSSNSCLTRSPSPLVIGVFESLVCAFVRDRSICPKLRVGSMTSRTSALSFLVSFCIRLNLSPKPQSRINCEDMNVCYLPGKPPSVFRSHSIASWYSGASPATTLSDNMVTVKTPPVAGTSATSPRDVENVCSSSCANWRKNLIRV